MRWAVPAFLALASLALADKVDVLTNALLTDPSFRVRAQAAAVLGSLRERRAVDRLIVALGDENDAVRMVAAMALGQVGDRAALQPLRAALDDAALAPRVAAQKAILAIEAGGSDAAANAPRREIHPMRPVGEARTEISPPAASPLRGAPLPAPHATRAGVRPRGHAARQRR